LRYWRTDLRRVDPDLLRLASAVQSGSVVWDVGANVGLFSFAAASRAGESGRVVAVEPDLDNLRLLARSQEAASEVGGYAPVEIMPCAVAGIGTRAARFEIAKRARSSNALQGFRHSQMGGILETRWVPALSLDDLLDHFPAPQVLKIDVEGAEVEVLGGGSKLLGEVRPAVFVEVGTEHSSRLKAIFQAGDYRLFDGEHASLLEREVQTPPWNCIAVPTERLAEIRKWF
jgi:FkbM family methyltransferase